MLGNDKLITPEVTLRTAQGENKVSEIVKHCRDRLHRAITCQQCWEIWNVRNVGLYHYVGCVNVICSFHSRQRGESDPRALGYGRRVI